MSEGCTECGGQLSRSVLQKRARGVVQTGLCRSCWLESRRNAERRCCECSAKLANYRAVRCQPCNNRRLAKDRQREERRIARMREALKRPDVRARRLRANRLLGERRMRWCPVERRAEYFKLLKKHGYHEMAKAELRSRMTPLERQVSLLMEGKARLVPKIEANREPDFTLGGVSTGMLE